MLAKERALPTPEGLSSLKLPDWLKPGDLRICCLKMFPACSRMTKGGHLLSSSPRWMTWGTVEWRCFNSTLHAGKVAAYVNLCLAISAQAIAQRSTVMRKTHSDNELFTFRVWLVRLGLNGDEFKHTRDHLLANLDGDRAWRHDKDSYKANQRRNRQAER